MGGKEGLEEEEGGGGGLLEKKGERGLIEKKEGRALQGSIHCLRVFGTASTKFRVTVVLSKDKTQKFYNVQEDEDRVWGPFDKSPYLIDIQKPCI